MSITEYLIDESLHSWEQPVREDRKNRGFLVKYLADGEDDRPYAVFGIQPEGFENPAHFHTEPQFQVLLDGTVGFPQHSLTSVAVHFSDANSPYGPFLVGPNFKLAVVRNGNAEQVYMSDREGRKRRNPYGRELYGQARDDAWQMVANGEDGIEQQVLIDAIDGSGPGAEIVRCSAATLLHCPPAEYGAFHIVVKGSAFAGDDQIGLHSMRYVRGTDVPTPLRAGDDGMDVLALTFGPAPVEDSGRTSHAPAKPLSS